MQSRCGLSGAQLYVLQRFGPAEALCVNEVAARTNTDQSSVSVVLSLLVKNGFLGKKPSPTDRRKSLHAVTPAGRRIAERSGTVVQDRLMQGISLLSQDEKTQLARLLEKVVRGAELETEPASLFFEDDKKRRNEDSVDESPSS